MRYPDGVTTKTPREGTVTVGIDEGGKGTCRLSTPMRNVGRGLAVITGARLYAMAPIQTGEGAVPRVDPEHGPDRERYWQIEGRYPEISKPYLPDGEETQVSFAYPPGDELPTEAEAREAFRYVVDHPRHGFVVQLDYWDFAFDEHFNSGVVLTRDSDGWRVERLHGLVYGDGVVGDSAMAPPWTEEES